MDFLTDWAFALGIGVVGTLGLVGFDHAWVSGVRDTASREVLLLRLPQEEERRFMELLKFSSNKEQIEDALYQAKAKSSDLVLEKHAAFVAARRSAAKNG